MRELTNERPKPMLEVQGKPILELILEGLIGAGIREVFIVTGFRAEVIEDHFGDGSRWGVRIACGRQTVQDGTGKAPEVARDFVGTDDFLLTYGDILVKPETYPQMIRRFREGDFSGLVTVTRGQEGRSSEFERNKQLADRLFPGRFLQYFSLDYRGWDRADFSELAVKQVEEGRQLGAAGFKEFKRLGLYLRDGAGKRTGCVNVASFWFRINRRSRCWSRRLKAGLGPPP